MPAAANSVRPAVRPQFDVPAAATFAGLLRAALGEPYRLVWTQNRRRLASARREAAGWVFRLQHLFAAGGVTQAELLVAVLVRRERGRAGLLTAWCAEQQRRAHPTPSAVRPTPTAPGTPVAPHLPDLAVPPGSVGQALPADAAAGHGLLSQLFAELNASYFHNACQASIGWGRGGHGARRRRRSLQLGCYDFIRREIRIHPALAADYVPRYVVELVVYHEMLHEVFGVELRRGRRSVHPPEFVACEQSHPRYGLARAWERKHLGRLLAWRA